MRGDFRLFDFLRSDLVRNYYLISEGVDHPGGIRLWTGLLSPRFLPVLIYRLSYFFGLSKFRFLSKIFTMLNLLMFGIEISPRCYIGRGLFLPHTSGTVIGAWEIGDNAIIFQGVTLGAKEADFSYKKELRPLLGNNVIVGAGAKVLGGIYVGDNVRIGANAVVTKNVPENTMAVGVPAKIFKNI